MFIQKYSKFFSVWKKKSPETKLQPWWNFYQNSVDKNKQCNKT